VIVVALFRGQEGFAFWHRVNPWYFLGAVVLMVTAWCTRAVRTHFLVSALGRRIPVVRLLEFYVATAFAAHVTPFSAGGIPLYFYLMRREGLSVAKATALTVLENMLSALVPVLLIPLLILAWRFGLPARPSFRETSVWIAAIVLPLGWLGYVFVRRPHTVTGFITRTSRSGLLKKVFGSERLERWGARAAREYILMRQALALVFYRRRMALVWGFFLTVWYWFVFLFVSIMLLWGMGLHVNLVLALGAQVLFYLLEPLIPTPGGSGGAELAFAYLFGNMVPAAAVAPFVTMWRFITFYLSLAVGGFSFARLVGEPPRPRRA